MPLKKLPCWCNACILARKDQIELLVWDYLHPKFTVNPTMKVLEKVRRPFDAF